MAILTIEIPDTLHEQMAHVDLNWSEICSRAIQLGLSSANSQPEQPSLPWIDTASLPANTVIKPYEVTNDAMIHPSQLIDELNACIKATEKSITLAKVQYLPSAFINQEVRAKVLVPGSHWKSCFYTTRLVSYIMSIDVREFSVGTWTIYNRKGIFLDVLKDEVPFLKIRFLENKTYELLEFNGLVQPPQEIPYVYTCDDENLCFRVRVPESNDELVFTGSPQSPHKLAGSVASTLNETEKWFGKRVR